MAASLKDIGEKFVNAAQDISTIEVLTFSGKLTGTLTGGKIDWDQFKPDAAGSALRLVAATRIDADLDVVNFRSEDADELPDDLIQLHEAAVKSSVEARTGFVRMVLTSLKG